MSDFLEQGLEGKTPKSSNTSTSNPTGFFSNFQEAEGNRLPYISIPIKLETKDARYPRGYEFPILKLLDVTVEEKESITKGKQTIIFFKVGNNKEEQKIGIFTPDLASPKLEIILRIFQQRIKSFIDETGINFNYDLITPNTSIVDFATIVKEQFNTSENKEILKTSTFFFKVVWGSNNKATYPELPLGNFIQKAKDKEGKNLPCIELNITPNDNLIPPSGGKKNTVNTVGALGNDLSDLADIPDFNN